MKPRFALSLSFDGIRLLHRAAGGWRVVGDVALDAGDMGAELAVLRKTASALEPGNLRTKVLLPNEQIKYLSIDTPDQDRGARNQAARIALEGATPYAVDDLAFDISIDGDQTHIAAVARETLAEAEGFAQDHLFHPVSFAAIPGDQPYLGEPFFGTAAAASSILEPDDTVEPDGIAVVVIGDIDTPSGPVVGPDETETAQVDALAEPDAVAPVKQPAQPASTANAVETPAPEASPPVAQETAKPEPEKPKVAITSVTSEAGSASAKAEAASPPKIGFASRRVPEQVATPRLDGVKRDGTLAAEGSVTSGHIDIEPDSPSPDETPPEAVPEPTAPKEKSSFLSRRKHAAKPAPTAIPTAPPPSDIEEGSETERMTIFGARNQAVRGKPRFLGLILTATLLVFLAGIAAWASVFLDDGISLSRLFGDRSPQTTTAVLEDQQKVDKATEAGNVEIASLDPSLSAEDAAVLDALRDAAEPTIPTPPTEDEVEAAYATNGIWPRAPQVPSQPTGLINIEDLYLTSIDPVSTAKDALALPAMTSFGTDVSLAAFSSPAAAGTAFALDENGLVIPTALGALSPDGFTVFLGRPPLVPPVTPTRFQTAPEDNALRSALAAARPQPRPADLVEKTERAQLAGLTRRELARFRPALRPKSLQQKAAAQAAALAVVKEEPDATPIATDGAVALALAAPSPVESATKLAVRASVRPDGRPRNFSRIVKRAQRAAPKEPVRVASAATIAPRTVTPKIPSSASVAKQATVKNALNLRKVNLIGVYGKPSSRRALVRLGNGRYKKVVVGDKIDGGRISAIGESELRYKKRGRDLVLKMPR